MADPKNNSVGSIIGIVLVLGMLWFFFGGGFEKQAAKNMKNIEYQVASDAEKQYEIAKRSGTAIDACVHAGLVSAAYIQAKDEAQYQIWKSVEKEDCRKAGLNR